jgi:TetR/AcrR family transcriptional regulator, regulator of cefoperazone and chloramphenicol sensitivity
MPDHPAARLPAPRHNRNSNDARERLLQAGLRLFAQQGYASTSTRELAQAAKVNVAAISYYFGDKAGLYRAAFIEPLASGPGDGLTARPGTVNPGRAAAGRDPTLPEVLEQIFDHLLLPLNNGEQARWCIQLHFREMVEPTGLWAEEIEQEIRPMHDLLVRALRQHLAKPPTVENTRAASNVDMSEPPRTAEPELRRLALAITGLAVNLYVSHDVITRLEPDLLPGSDTAAGWRDALRRYALAMVEAESRRRASLTPSAIR